MSEQLDLDAIEARERAAILPDEEPAMADMNEEILALIAELRKLREENASLQAMLVAGNELTNKACALLSQLTGEPWPPKPPEVG